MAEIGNVKMLLNALPADIRGPVTAAFEYVLDNLSFGANRRAANFQLYKFQSTTHTTANTEFSVAHNFRAVPSKVIQFLDLSEVGSQIVPLTVSRAADVERLYLKSSSTGAVVSFYLEP